ncbi:hypothetical protein [Salisaeta longa]|uniref:hypothetical protein n=1 Tax=Salisaeta longa TaxID=503170 RepID=UPI0003B7B7A4|nr:hypothetical protein [Salisaeta longa]
MRSLLNWYWKRRRAQRVQRISANFARARVKRGASFLDAMQPGWHRDVDLDRLELASGEQCVLGQLHGEFRMGLGRSLLWSMDSAPLSSASPVDYGFQCVRDVPEEAQARDYRLLNIAWHAAVHARQCEDQAAPDAPATRSEAPERQAKQPAEAFG